MGGLAGGATAGFAAHKMGGTGIMGSLLAAGAGAFAGSKLEDLGKNE